MKRLFCLSVFIAAALMAFAPAPRAFAEEEAKAEAKGEAKAEATGEANGDPNLVPLEIELPKPMFTGTPKNLRVPNMEQPSEKKRKPPMVPKGVENLALHKKVQSSDEEPIIGEIDYLTDGDKEGQDGSYVELGPGLQWVQIDLEKPSEIFVIVLWHYHNQARIYHDVVVQAADDPDFIKDVKTVYNNDHDNSAGLGLGKDLAYIEGYEGRVIQTKDLKTRYLRFYTKGNTSNDQNHYIEVEVWGRAAE